MKITDKPPWTSSKLKKFGSAIREQREQVDSDVSYYEVVRWYGDLASSVREIIKQLDLSSVLGDQIAKVNSRPKTIHTLRQKLIANPHLQLPSIVDLAGVRVEAAMDLDDQDDLAAIIASELNQNFDAAVSDTRSSPHSGYRALHLRARFPAGRVEIQIRTALQSSWANLYETLADNLGREIRYGKLPANSEERSEVEGALRLSASFRTIEERKRVLRRSRMAQDHATEQLEVALMNVLEQLPEGAVVQRNAYTAKLEKCRVDRQAETRNRQIDDATNEKNDQHLIQQMKSMEEFIANRRRKEA
ncbi:hypothetical protein IU479_27260 [Nocardia abscessus]|uniref:hypothetical protein n=1 Tax=Nocardia abscessus TaxID=120957 RepID=UPI001894B952|nr:hypothetical protein [Nocardia abscessus]MBF6221798.1 hypothetical protein [Nocardia abscessus]